jgi:hypothetical protein
MHDAQVISTKLKSRALAFIGHDTSGAMSYFLYDRGRKTGQRDWAYRTEPSEKEFADLNLYVPACYPRQEGGDTWLAVMDSSVGRIARADILEMASR